jgi:hypothetical protein
LRKSVIDEQNRCLLAKQREFRIAAVVIAAALSAFSEVAAIAVIGSVPRSLSFLFEPGSGHYFGRLCTLNN